MQRAEDSETALSFPEGEVRTGVLLSFEKSVAARGFDAPSRNRREWADSIGWPNGGKGRIARLSPAPQVREFLSRVL
jgi:hypothetical protein